MARLLSERPRRKGAKLPSPKQQVARAQRRALARLRWYGNSVRDLQLLSGCAGWYRGHGCGRAGLVPLRWVFVHDPLGGRDDYFYSTDPNLRPGQIVECFAARWSIEVTFQEIRAHLGFESTRQWCGNSVRRAGALLLGLFSVVSLIYGELARQQKVKVHTTACYHKSSPTFADALAAVRTLLWEQIILPHAPGSHLVAKIPPALRELLLEHLTAAA